MDADLSPRADRNGSPRPSALRQGALAGRVLKTLPGVRRERALKYRRFAQSTRAREAQRAGALKLAIS